MKRIGLCNGWTFAGTWTDAFLNFEGDHAVVRLPHTVAELPLHCADEAVYQAVCGYRRIVEIPDAWQDKRIFLRFDGAAHVAKVYVNGTLAATHAGGYTAFDVDISGLTGPLRIAVELNSREDSNIPPFGHTIDYMTFGGLYREVWLMVAEASHIEDVYVTTPTLDTVSIDATIRQPEKSAAARLRIEDAQGQLVHSGELKVPVAAHRISIAGVLPWTPETPVLYSLTLSLHDAQGKGYDEYTVRFGFRTAVFAADGFYLNGNPYKIIGLNRHQSYPYVGYAMPASMQWHDAQVLKQELHCNAVRTSHYPQAQSFLDACDELGLLVFTELPGWQHIGDAAWKDAACDSLRELILQQRNHPSIILWGVRVNESQDDSEFYARTNAIASQLDPSRQTSGVRFLWKSELLEDVYSFNDFSHAGSNGGLLPKWLISPAKDKGYLISEYNGHMFSTKTYDTPTHRLSHALRHATVLDAVYKRKDVAGGFGWCMADYYTHGDFGSGDRICYHGVLDMFRNAKLAAAVYASGQEEQPVLAVGSDMHIGDYPAGSVGENYAFTNAQSIRFYKNDQYRGEFPVTSRRWKHLPHPPVSLTDVIGNELEQEEKWGHKRAEAIKDSLLAIQRYGVKIPPRYIAKTGWRMVRWGVGPGKLMRLFKRYCENWGVSAPRYRYDAIQGGQVVASVTRQTNAALHLTATASHQTLREGDSYDVASVRIRIADANGAIASYCQIPVMLRLEGPAELIGPPVVTLEGGMCGTYIRTTGEAGDITLTMETGQTEPLTLHLAAEVMEVLDTAHALSAQ